MASEVIEFTIKSFDDMIQIIPMNGMKDNSIYEVRLKGVKAKNGTDIETPIVKFATAMSPMYCGIMDVTSLMDTMSIPDDIILYNIREASRYADYVYATAFPYKNKLDSLKLPFVVKEFTRFKAARDCLLKIYMSLVADNVIQGQLGEVVFKTRPTLPDLNNLLKYLDDEIKKWLDGIRGYNLEGRAKMQTAIRGYDCGGPNPRTSIDRMTTPKPVEISMNRGVFN